MFRGLDGIGAHAFEVEPMHLRPARQHRHQPPCAHLDRLLHHVVQTRMFQWCEQVVDVRALVLGAHKILGDEGSGLLRDIRQFGPPFAVASVEDEHRIAGLQAQDIDQIIHLLARQPDCRAGGKWRVEKEAGGIEFVSGQGRTPGTRSL